MEGMLDVIGSTLSAFIGWVGEVLQALTTAGGEGVAQGALYPLLGLFAIGIVVSLFMVIFKAVRRITWGA